MKHHEIKRHFAEICEFLWNRIQRQEKLDSKTAAKMQRVVTNFAVIAWNISVQHDSYSLIQKALRSIVSEKFKSYPSVLPLLLDVAELKWLEYRDDKETILCSDVKVINGQPQIITLLKGERSDINTAADAFQILTNFSKIPEPVNVPSAPELVEDPENMVPPNASSAASAGHSAAAEDGNSRAAGLDYPISYEELEEYYFRAVLNITKECKQKMLNELLCNHSFLAPLCRNAGSCFENSQRIKEQCLNSKTPIHYSGSVPELILAIAVAYTDTDLRACDEVSFGAYLKDARELASLFWEDRKEFYNQIILNAEHDLLLFITNKIKKFALPEKELRKQFTYMLALGLIVGDTREAQHAAMYR